MHIEISENQSEAKNQAACWKTQEEISEWTVVRNLVGRGTTVNRTGHSVLWNKQNRVEINHAMLNFKG